MTQQGSGGEQLPSPLPCDSLDMWGATLGLPDQIAAAVHDADLLAEADLPAASDVQRVVALGMGGSGVGGELLAAVAARELAVPATVAHGYAPPAWVGPGTLVFATSCSGDTEETLAATEVAADAGAFVVVVAGGGALVELAVRRGWPVVPVPTTIPQPRAALAALSVPPLVVLETVGMLRDVRHRLGAAASHLLQRRPAMAAPGDGEAAVLAYRIGRTLPLVHGPEGIGAVAATRWRTQVNENAKTPAFSAVYPELCHNELAGWGQHGDVTRQLLTVVALRMPDEHPQVARRITLVSEILREVVADVIEARAQHTDPLVAFYELAILGDLVSLYLAAAEGTDPGPVPILGELKAQLRA